MGGGSGDPPASGPPAHCSDTASTHTGVDYFCCNRAVGEEVAAVEAGSMTSFIATGGRFPILVVTHTRAEMLNRTLASLLLSVRCVRVGDILVVQDGAAPDVRAVAGSCRAPRCAQAGCGGEGRGGGNEAWPRAQATRRQHRSASLPHGWPGRG
jgi:hypothetical protein